LSGGAPGWTGLAPAKINLHLHVVGRRADGYHLLDSLVAFGDVGDMVTLRRSDAPSLTVTGPFAADVPQGPANLAFAALAALAAAAGRAADLAITLDKRLPVASGIGGGSADAGAVLRGAASLWGLAADDPLPAAVAARLGADVPACLAPRTSHLAGVGEILIPGPILGGIPVVLANPGVALPTPDVFRAYRAAEPVFSVPAAAMPAVADGAALAAILAETRNDLTAAAVGLVPAIGRVIGALAARHGCRLARMSGSGATCFGLFDDPDSASAAAKALAAYGWWTAAGRLL
jgi:4-diphosphocytidyl-2-C-methyl-D-erythritol kinase